MTATPGTSCPEPTSLLDSRVLGRLFASGGMQDIFTDAGMVRAWLQAEAALAGAQSELGVIPGDAGTHIARAAAGASFELTEFGSEVLQTAHPLMPVIRGLIAASGVHGAYVHFGATTQDITDTGLVLQAKSAYDLIEAQLARLCEALAELAEKYRDLPMVGRTHAQHALPITLGLKFGIILAECERHRERLRQSRPRVLVGQLGGAVGTMAALGPRALEVQRRMMELLGLAAPVTPWHTARDGLAELVSILTMISATCGKVANEIRVLQRTEVAELEEPFHDGKVGSSTMPHKRNPMYAEYILSNAILARQLPASMYAAMLQEHERDMSMWGVEWTVVPQSFQLAGGLLQHVHGLLGGLIVHEENIHRNLHQLGDLMLSEVAMMMLASELGKDDAHEAVYRASMKGWQTGRPLVELLLEDSTVTTSGIDATALSEAMVPERYTGVAPSIVDAALESYRNARRDA
jgi:3-carboxy-cis,cis-muconate cycloisomerase